VVVVVPALPERDRDEQRNISRTISGIELPGAEEVAYRIDATRGVGHHEEPNPSAPEESGRCADPRFRDDPPDGRRDEQARDHNERAPVLQPPKKRVLLEVGDVAFGFDRFDLVEDVPNVGVPEPAESAKEVMQVPLMRTVRISRLVRSGVVAPVLSGPDDRRALSIHTPENGKDPADRPWGLKRTVSKKTVIAYRGAESGQNKHPQKDPEVHWRK
jgi:hypothetical protein